MIAQLSGPKSCLVYFCLALGLVGCVEPPPESGYVRGKDYQPAHSEDGGDHEECWSYDSDGDCTFSITVDDPDVQVPDKWFLLLEDCKTKDNGKQECAKGWLRVDETDYHRFQVGQHFPDPR